MQKTENELIMLAKQGNDIAFEKLLSNYKNLVVSICRKYFLIGGDVDDLLQEGMIGLYKAVKTFSPDKNVAFAGFAKKVVEGQIINAIKSANRNKNLPLNEYYTLNNQGAIETQNGNNDTKQIHIKSNQATPDNLVISEDNLKNILSQINKQLSAFEITVLEQYLDGYSYIQIAENLNQPTKSIDNALNRIKNKLKFLKQIRSE